MPKPRRSDNIGLPERWRIKHGAYYYRVPVGDEFKWGGRQDYRLGSTFDEAVETFRSVQLGERQVEDIHDFLSEDQVIAQSIAAPRSGIYFLIRGDTIVYVGQSRSVFSRVLDHSDKSFDRAAFLPVDEQFLYLVEARYIQKFSPEYNVQCFGNGTLRPIGADDQDAAPASP